MLLDVQTIDELAAGVDSQNLVDSLSELIAIPSVNPFDEPATVGCREKEVAEYYLDQMADLGLTVNSRDVVPGRPNVWGRLKGSGDGPSIMLAGHLDTVGVVGYDDPFNPRFENGRIYGRGSCDMKGALAAYLEVARVVQDSGIKLKGDLIIAGLADEEHKMIGSRDFGTYGVKADFGVIGEPTELVVCPAHKGQQALFVRTFGRAVHSSVPEKGINAIEHMAKVIAAFGDYNDELATREPHDLCGHGRFSPGVIRGGDIVSSVPDLCELEVDRRTLPGESWSDVLSDYRSRLDRLKSECKHFDYELSEPTLDVPPLDVPLESPIVSTLCECATEVMGKEVKVSGFSGGTDAPHLGFPSIIFGPGSAKQAHTINEYVEMEEVRLAAEVYLKTVLNTTSC